MSWQQTSQQQVEASTHIEVSRAKEALIILGNVKEWREVDLENCFYQCLYRRLRFAVTMAAHAALFDVRVHY